MAACQQSTWLISRLLVERSQPNSWPHGGWHFDFQNVRCQAHRDCKSTFNARAQMGVSCCPLVGFQVGRHEAEFADNADTKPALIGCCPSRKVAWKLLTQPIRWGSRKGASRSLVPNRSRSSAGRECVTPFTSGRKGCGIS